MRRVGQRQDEAHGPKHIARLPINQKTVNGVGVEFIAFQLVGMIGRILKSILHAVDLVPDPVRQRHQVRRIGSHRLKVRIELAEQFTSVRGNSSKPSSSNATRSYSIYTKSRHERTWYHVRWAYLSAT